MKNTLSLIAITLFCVACLLNFSVNEARSRAAEPSTGPSPTSQQANADPDFLKGQQAARKDLASGILGEKLPIPEAFMLEWMDKESEDANLLPYYQAIVADRYGVKSGEVVFIPNRNDNLHWANGYNHEMRPAIERRCGHDALDKAWKEACYTSTKKRATYLDARATRQKAKNSPATHPAGASPSK